MRFIGDVHGKFEKYLPLITDVTESIQVGDFGAGINPLPTMGAGHRFIRGNHDSPQVCAASPHWIPDNTFDGKIFYVGGAKSRDAAIRRAIGYEHWDDEEIAYDKWDAVFNHYETCAPDIVVSHDSPHEIVLRLFPQVNKERSQTSMGLQTMLNIHTPKLWIFGHYHETIDWTVGSTRFICIGELEFMDIDI